MTTPAWLRDLGGADAYELLGVARDATTAEILRAHRRLIRELHPDRATGDAERARLVNLARQILVHPDRRAEYDRHADQPTEPEPTRSSWDADDVTMDAVPSPRPPSAWESEDVIVGAEPPPEPSRWSSGPDYDAYPAYPVPPPSLGLPIAALVLAFLCTPIGLILGMMALRQHWHVGGTGKRLAIAAVVVSAVSLVLTCLCYAGALLSSPASSG